ncbi:Cytochrome c [Novipirellula galeiformis]|uniref:Cytochrome c n=1 Tax=Novipirellula galeiformis TaxID=2528004 RepID=A0A5C6CAH5_9BACT|nr:PVC-type heme-binding CxxCH protein [Novipirellula galeiformis]TWU20481.1 Cytochrome c [Novipirellula galeiformis]
MFRSILFLVVLAMPAVFVRAETAEAIAPTTDTLAPKLEFPSRGVKLTMVAEHPEIMTPTGIDVDHDGAVWVIASHTHFRPDDYSGPTHDEIVVFAADGRRRVFYNRTVATMDLELGRDGWVYLAQRDRILRVRDSDGDGVGDQEETIAELETKGTYPHNGLAGLAWHPNGDLLFSLGENYWEQWTLRGHDGNTVRGTGEGGVFRCTASGEGLRRIAKGFWNPFGLCVRQDGTIFAAENDPGALPPCRLLHVVEGGEYGFQRLYGESAFHPFVCWNGELRGTLPMVHSVGEAPCGIAPLGRGLIVPSWTDHRIDYYPLEDDGASFRSERRVLVQGSDFFRPTCITQASATVFYLADWVVGSYQLHGKGRVWKLEIDAEAADWLGSMTLPPATEAARLAAKLRSGGEGFSEPQLFEAARSQDPFVARAAIDALATRADHFTIDAASKHSTPDRITMLLAIRKASAKNDSWIRHFWQDETADLRFETLRWIAEEQRTAFLPEVEEHLARTHDYRLFEAGLATRNILSGNPRAGVTGSEILIQRVQDETSTAETRAFALRLLDPHHSKLNEDLLDRLIALDNPTLLSEVVFVLTAQGTPAARQRLLQAAQQDSYATSLRADAIAGLASPTDDEITALIELAANETASVREEALRSLRFATFSDSQRESLKQLPPRFPESAKLVAAVLAPDSLTRGRPQPDDLAAWQQRLSAVTEAVDVQAGRRIFYHASVGNCGSCHRRQGRGNVVGPDLSSVHAQGDQASLLTALLQPSREVAPQFFPRALILEDGRTFVGLLLRDGGGGNEIYRDNTGRERAFATSDIVERHELTTSMMPEGLVSTMTDRELRDLLAYLREE